MKIKIIGGGPVGMYCAKELASKNDVEVYEEHKEIGRPIQCTGIVTRELEKVIPFKKEFVVNRLKRAIIHSPRKKMTIHLDDVVVDRSRLDKYIAGKASDAGVKIFEGKAIRKVPKGIVIGADGPNSIVRKHLNPGFQAGFYVGKQATVRGEFDSDTFEVFLGSKAPNFFAWIVPESDRTARIGLATLKNPDAYFKKFCKGRIRDIQGGIIPIYNRIKTSGRGKYIVGDAALQVKASTGGGLVPGLKAAGILADCINNKKNYEIEWRKALRRELVMHKIIRNTLDKFSDKDYDNLIMKLKDCEEIFKKHNRDSSVRLGLSLLAKKPSLAAFAKKLI